jgi:transcriptional regulator GlxA family with amidase domain
MLAEELTQTAARIRRGRSRSPRDPWAGSKDARLRLNAARRDLLRRDAEESVGTVAVRWGLLHLGRFSADHRRMFGESPSETRRAALRRR